MAKRCITGALAMTVGWLLVTGASAQSAADHSAADHSTVQSADQSADEAGPADDTAAYRALVREWMSADPDYAKLQYDVVKAQAGLAVRIEYLAGIGILCRLLSEDDARLIVANGQAEMELGRSVLFDDQQAEFAIYLDGLRHGALAAGGSGPPSTAQCEEFAQPGGALIKLLTWTGRQQFISPGILASPRTIP